MTPAVVPEQLQTLAQRVNYKLVQTEDDRQANALFGGGLKEAAEQALNKGEEDGGVRVGSDYEQEGKVQDLYSLSLGRIIGSASYARQMQERVLGYPYPFPPSRRCQYHNCYSYLLFI
jgi:hypothetical protein